MEKLQRSVYGVFEKESGSVVYNTIFEICASLFDSVLCIYFLTKFNYATWRRNYYLVPAILIPFVFQLFADTYMPNFSLLSTSIQFFLSLAYAFLICKKHYYRAFCSACIYKITLIIINSCIFSLLFVFVDDFESLLTGGDNGIRYLIVFLAKALIILILALILKVYNRESNGNLLQSMLIFLFTVITIYGLKLTLDTIADTTMISQIRINLFVIALIFLSLSIFLYILLSQISKLQIRNYELQLLNEKSKFEEAKYQEALNVWNSAEKIRHDIKHHMITISGMIQDGNTQGCQTYLDKYLPQLQNYAKFSCSGNTVIDYLLESKLSALENTEIIISGTVGNLADIRDTDLASLIGNILDNATEAVKKVWDKRIELYFGSQNDNRIIICKNTIAESVLRNNKALRSTKSSRVQHGFGHQIVAEIAKKYNGLVHYFEENDMFGVQIILPSSK